MAASTLKQFSVTSTAVEGLDERKEMGRGCYGAVYEVRLHGLPCIAKRLHDILVGRGREERVSIEQRRAVIGRFREECELLSGLRHPNVVQFMGVHYGRDEADISLIMEYMHMDLDQCMKTYPNIPLPYKTSILRDVAYGLAYLHSIPIIHRDLNAGNVLLTESLRAKIADLGVARLFDMDTLMHRTKSPCPGAYDFMPPESFKKKPKYDIKLDVFSFGHLAIFVANQQFPNLIDSDITEQDVQKNQRQVAKRRESLVQMGGPDHPLYSIAVQCLSDTPDQRPTSKDLVRMMEELCEKQPRPHKSILALTKVFENEVSILDGKLEQMTRRLEEKSERLENELQTTRSLTRDKTDVIEQLQIKTQMADELTEMILKKEANYNARLVYQTKQYDDLSAEFDSLKCVYTSEIELQKEVAEKLNSKQSKVDELEEKIVVAETKAETYEENFYEERKDRERKHSEYYEMKENSAVTIRRLEKRLQACERELEEEKRKGHQLRLERTRTTAQRDQRPRRSVVELQQVASSSVKQEADQQKELRRQFTSLSTSKSTSTDYSAEP